MKVKCLLVSLSLIISACSLASCGVSDKIDNIFRADYVNESESKVSKSDDMDSESPKLPESADSGEAEVVEAVEALDSALEMREGSDSKASKSDDAKTAVDKEASDDIVDAVLDDIIDDYIETDTSKAFILTAGEWNDNNNWGFFKNLVKSQTIEFPSYGLDPTCRIAVTVEFEGCALPNYEVKLLDGDNVVWTAITDKNGVAYLFWDGEGEATLDVLVAGAAEPTPVTVRKIDTSSQDSSSVDAEITVQTELIPIKKADTEVMFILDTTGSMADEIAYLQMDFASIAEEVAREGMKFSVNFYRDEGDEYVTKCNPFTDDVKEIQKLLNSETADGGGDTPEAVADILKETIIDGEWSDTASKIAFLIFDAPPHEEKEKEVVEAIKAAAEKGIRLVPVVSSNADRGTELFGRAAAIMTNSNYVFLTDDSGVGESHLEPIIGDYDVELLHDIIVRNINDIVE